jgi:hypothetical protein
MPTLPELGRLSGRMLAKIREANINIALAVGDVEGEY